jgi:hypothetical protein
MSYDLYIERKLCAACAAAPGPTSGYFNYTSNVSPMWRKAMPESDGLYGMDGMLCKDAAPILARGLERMKAEPDAYRAMNPPNGWGDYDRQFAALTDLLFWMNENPECVVRVWA